MEKYSIMSISDEKKEYLIIANTYENPINDFLADDCVPMIDNGDVIFDLAIINGLNFNRFVYATVKNHKLLYETIRPVTLSATEVLQKSEAYFKKNAEIVERSILPSVVKYMLLHSNRA
ncbi:type II toxin-antitoxin system RnlB family antitoxin [Clostridium sp.]